jgi:hypothetical protein
VDLEILEQMEAVVVVQVVQELMQQQALLEPEVLD